MSDGNRTGKPGLEKQGRKNRTNLDKQDNQNRKNRTYILRMGVIGVLGC